SSGRRSRSPSSTRRGTTSASTRTGCTTSAGDDVERGGLERPGSAQGALLLPLLPGVLPDADPLPGVELPVRAGEVDGVAGDGVLVEPFRVLGREVDTPVRDVARALGVHRPRRGVEELPRPGHPHVVLGVDLVVALLALVDPDGRGVHGHLLVLEDDDLLARAGLGLLAGASAADGEALEGLAAPLDLHLVVVDVDRRQLLPSDGHRSGRVVLYPGFRAGLVAGERRVDAHPRAGLPIVLRAPHQLAVVQPAPGALGVRGA